MMESTPDFEWADYFEASETGKLHPLFERLTPHLRDGAKALDLGCGVGLGTAFLCERGQRVSAVDIHEEALMRLKRKVPAGAAPEVIQSDFRELEFQESTFDLVVATNALYFLPPEYFAAFWRRLVSWIKPGGIFMGQFMGPGDAWSFREDYNTHTALEVQRLLTDFEVLHLHDDERDTVIITGKPNHVHVVHVIARKL